MGKKKGAPPSISDLTFLPSLTLDDVLSSVKARYLAEQPFSRIGSTVYTCVNPYTDVEDLSSDATSKLYYDAYKDTSGQPPQLEPHPFELANNAYYALRRTGMDQSVVPRGESASGKSLFTDLVMQHLFTISGASKKDIRVHNRISASSKLLAAFGHATIAGNSDSTRFSSLTKVLFNNRGKMLGCERQVLHLEGERIVKFKSDERNFHAFYYMLAGASSDQKSLWRLADAASFHYLNQGIFNTADHDDKAKFDELTEGMKALGLGKKSQSNIFGLLAAILHLGNIQFDDATSAQGAASVRNRETLDLTASLLGITSPALETSLTYKSKLIHGDRCTVFLNAKDCVGQRDTLARCLYDLLFTWLVSYTNEKLRNESYSNKLCIVDVPGNFSSKMKGFDGFIANAVEECVGNWAVHRLFDTSVERLEKEGVNNVVRVPHESPEGVMDVLLRRPQGIMQIIHEETERAVFQAQDPSIVQSVYDKVNSSLLAKPKAAFAMALKHTQGEVTYDTLDFIHRNYDAGLADFVPLFRGSADQIGSNKYFLAELFAPERVSAWSSHLKSDSTMPTGMQSLKRRNTEKRKPGISLERERPQIRTVLKQLEQSMHSLLETLQETQPWFVFCLNPNANQEAGEFDSRKIRMQMQNLDLPNVIRQRVHLGGDYSTFYKHEDFVQRYGGQLHDAQVDENRPPRQQAEAFMMWKEWSPKDMLVGEGCVILSAGAWRSLEDELRRDDHERRRAEKRVKKRGDDGNTVITDTSYQRADSMADSEDDYMDPKLASPFADNDSLYADTEAPSQAGIAGRDGNPRLQNLRGVKVHDAITGAVDIDKDDKEVEEETLTRSRKNWICCTYLLTWYIPSFCIKGIGRKRRPDIIMAWREKVAIFLLVMALCASFIFFVVGVPEVLCPRQEILTLEELGYQNDIDDDPEEGTMAIFGNIYEIQSFIINNPTVHQQPIMETFRGLDVTDGFPRPAYLYCDWVTDETVVFSNRDINGNGTLIRAQHQSFLEQDPENGWTRIDNALKRGKKKTVGWKPDWLKERQIEETPGRMFSVDEVVYDLTAYFALRGDEKNRIFGDTTDQFLFEHVGEELNQYPEFMAFWESEPAFRNCWNSLFTAGVIDKREGFNCLFANYLLLVAGVFITAVMGFKFLAALQIGGRQNPQEHDKFVIVQVPCYTEGEDSLRRTIDSLAKLEYDDKRKLIVMICDGMIVGSGNDRPTPRIVLDILGVDPELDPEPLSFQSLGEGMKQHNMGKVYSGLYEISGHLVPYLVITKVGKPSERSKPGNRGKRDSQMVLMRFLNKVHYDSPMSPLELEIYHQIKNVIGVNPAFYEYCLMVDADTTVFPDSLNMLIAYMLNNVKIMGLCGETRLANEKESWATMIQVYEYYISHHMSKAFESLFGSVTCLPGCFTMYRIRSPVKGVPLLISNDIVDEYGDNKVDTLHKKNLLSLGEDRYLTTLMLKHFPYMKTKFTQDALALTSAPEQWKVLMSQRRRWINSTVHNLAELAYLPQLCGFCCFSMRFVVFVDLFSTLVQPAIVGYIVYLIYRVVEALVTDDFTLFPTMALILLACVYAMQAIIFIIKKEWANVVWMIIYIFAMPFFGLMLPLYSFWHMDDFSWGNTRVIVGESGKKQVLTAESEKFDIRMIPHKKWSDYEAEMWEVASQVSDESRNTYGSHGTRQSAVFSKGGDIPRGVSYAPPGSVYGDMTYPNAAMANPRNTVYSMAPAQPPPMYGDVFGGQQPPVTVPPNARQSQMYNQQRMSSVSYSQAGYPVPQVGMSPMPMEQPRAPSQYSAQGGYASPRSQGSGSSSGLPTTEELMSEIHRILAVADMMTTTKKQIRDELSALFNVDLSSRKEYVNTCIETALQQKIQQQQMQQP